jgi:hypothetical protein
VCSLRHFLSADQGNALCSLKTIFMRLRSHLRFLCFVFLLLSKSVTGQVDSSSAQKPFVTPANLSMIQVSADFEPSTTFNGYLNKKLSASISMTTIHHVSAQAMDGARKQDSTRTLIAETELTTNLGDAVFLYKELGQSGTVKIIHYTAFIGRGTQALWLSIAYPAMFDALIEREVLSAVKSADLNQGK